MCSYNKCAEAHLGEVGILLYSRWPLLLPLTQLLLTELTSQMCASIGVSCSKAAYKQSVLAVALRILPGVVATH